MFSMRAYFTRGLVVALVAVPGFVAGGCKSGPTAPAPTPAPAPVAPPTPDPEPVAVMQISGSASLPAGAGGDLGNARAAIYRSLEEWHHNTPVAGVRATGDGARISFAFAELVPGTYYLDVWKDNDNSAGWTCGDFAGWFGAGNLEAPELVTLEVRDGETCDVGEIVMRPILTRGEAGGR